MRVIETIEEMQALTQKPLWNKKIGFVPTMGALHEGHISLIKKAREECSEVVLSIYVNPSQFGENEDLSNYPRTLREDLEKAKKAGAGFVFLPYDDEMYPVGYGSWINVEEITEILCGKSRPGHFRGVATIVAKLMNIVQPDFMYMGEKDYQQVAVLKKMINELHFKTKIVTCPIVREEDGLALSSRNKYLNDDERVRALCLKKSINKARELFISGETKVDNIRKEMESIISNANGVVDYIEFVDKDTLRTKIDVDNNTRVVLAVFIESTRLIDNSDLR